VRVCQGWITRGTRLDGTPIDFGSSYVVDATPLSTLAEPKRDVHGRVAAPAPRRKHASEVHQSASLPILPTKSGGKLGATSPEHSASSPTSSLPSIGRKGGGKLGQSQRLSLSMGAAEDSEERSAEHHISGRDLAERWLLRDGRAPYEDILKVRSKAKWRYELPRFMP
jgi:hypothetical protein